VLILVGKRKALRRRLPLTFPLNCFVAAISRVPSTASFGLTQLRMIRNMEVRMAKVMSKSELIQKIAEMHSNKNMARKDVKAVIESLAEIGYKELNKSGAFLVPGFAKFVVIKKPATKERSGINPFTKEPTIFKAKPARKIVKARPVKAAKDAVL
jgi:DNA-binding protein HU-beta